MHTDVFVSNNLLNLSVQVRSLVGGSLRCGYASGRGRPSP